MKTTCDYGPSIPKPLTQRARTVINPAHPATNGRPASHRLRVKSVLLATDLSEHSPKALRAAAGMANHFGWCLHILTVMEPPSFMHDVADNPLFLSVGECSLKTERELRRLVEHEIGDTEATCHVRVGKAAPEIAAAAEELDAGLIVLNSAARGRLAGWWYGSATTEIVRHARRPVLVIPNECLTHHQNK